MSLFEKTTISTLLLFLLASVHADTHVLNVAGDGSGDYNCDGRRDQMKINQALDSVADNSDYTNVNLKGPNTCLIDGSIFISGDTILEW